MVLDGGREREFGRKKKKKDAHSTTCIRGGRGKRKKGPSKRTGNFLTSLHP